MALDSGGPLRLVVDNHVQGESMLREHHHQVAERDVIMMGVPNTAGSLAPALSLVSDANINVE
jgi:hypothetical protein